VENENNSKLNISNGEKESESKKERPPSASRAGTNKEKELTSNDPSKSKNIEKVIPKSPSHIVPSEKISQISSPSPVNLNFVLKKIYDIEDNQQDPNVKQLLDQVESAFVQLEKHNHGQAVLNSIVEALHQTSDEIEMKRSKLKEQALTISTTHSAQSLSNLMSRWERNQFPKDEYSKYLSYKSIKDQDNLHS